MYQWELIRTSGQDLLGKIKRLYENYDFRKINDMILKKHNYDVKSYNSNIPMINLNESLTFKMIKLLKSILKIFFMGMEGSKTCLTIFKWYEVMKFWVLKISLKLYMYQEMHHR